MRLLAILSILSSLLGSQTLSALSIEEGTLPNKRLFAVEFPGGLSFYARHDRINSASLQKYQSGPYIVTEMVIDIASSDVLLRVYHTELMNASNLLERAPEESSTIVQPGVPDSVQKMIDRGRQSADRARSGAMVVKDYPTSTHAKTVEFRLNDLQELENFYRRFIDAYTGQDSPADENDSNATKVSLAGTVFSLK